MTYPENGQVSDATPIPALDSLKSNHPTLQGDYSAPLRYEEDGDDDQELLAEAIPLADTDDALMNGAVLPHRMVVVPIQGNCFQLETLDKGWYVQVTGDKGSLPGALEVDVKNPRDYFCDTPEDAPSSASVVVCRGLTSYPIYERDEANSLFETIRHAQHTIQVSLQQVRTPHIPWEETDDDPTGENLQAQLDIVDMDTAEVKNVHDLTIAIEEFMSGVKNGYEAYTPPDDDSSHITWNYAYYTIPILETLISSMDLPEWKFIPGSTDSEPMYLLWTENDSWLLRLKRDNTVFYSKGKVAFPVADGKNARLLYDSFSGDSNPFQDDDDDSEDLLGEVVSKCDPSEVVQKGDDPAEFFADDGYSFETDEVVEPPQKPTKTSEEIMTPDPFTPTPNQAIECLRCFDEEGSTKCVRPAHKTAANVQAVDKGTINYLKSVEGRVLTVLEAALADKGQRDAVKTLIKKEFRRTMNQVNRAQIPNDEE